MNSLTTPREKKDFPGPPHLSGAAGLARSPEWAAVAFIMTAGVCLYLPSIFYGFVFDDSILVVNYATVHNFGQALSDVMHLAYRSFRTLSYAVDFLVGGPSPVVFHLSNLFWHLLVLLMAWLVLKRICDSRRIALWALVFFAVHPIHIDAVAYVSGRRDILSALFTLIALYAFLRIRSSSGIAARLVLWPIVFLCFGLAFLSKEMGVITPMLMFLYDFTRRRASLPKETRWKGLRSIFGAVAMAWPFYLGTVAIGILVLSRVGINSFTGRFVWWGGTYLTNLMTSAKIILYDIYLMAFPVSLRADYSYSGFPVVHSASDITGWIALASIICLLAILAWLFSNKYYRFGFWGMWFLLALTPVLHFVIPHHEIFAEHYLYLASLGFCVILALLLEKGSQRFPRAGLAAKLVVTAGFVAMLLLHLPAYRSDFTLFSDVLEKAPACVRANWVIGNHYFDKAQAESDSGDLAAAKKSKLISAGHFERIVALPLEYELDSVPRDIIKKMQHLWQEGESEAVHRDVFSHANAWMKLGNIYDSLEEFDKAKKAYLAALEIGIMQPMIYDRLGTLFAERGNYQEALFYFEKGGTMKPDGFDIVTNAGVAHCGLKQWPQAKACFRKALAINSKYALANYYLAQAIMMSEPAFDKAEVIRLLKKALDAKLDPRLEPDANRQLAILQKR